MTDAPSAACHVDVYGLRVRSDIDLPDWPRIEPGEPDLVIRCEEYDGATFDGELYWTKTSYEEGDVRLEIRGVAKYAASRGTLIRVAPEEGAKPEDIRLFLTGALMGAILHQRGLYPLHASCVAIDGVGAAFAAPSGEGKSTLVGALIERGATFVSDDICVLDRGSDGVVRVRPGPARLKLDRAGLSARAARAEELEPAGGDRGKFHLPVDTPADRAATLPLRRVYLLASGEGEPRIERLEGLDAVSALVDDTYFFMYAAGMGLKPRVFKHAAELSRSLVVSRLTRPRGMEHMPAAMDLIARDIRG